MGHHDKEKSTEGTEHHQSGSSSGLVAQRRKELIAAKPLGLGGIAPKPTPAIKHNDVAQKRPEGELTHLTKSRPLFKQHRPPTRIPLKARRELGDFTSLLNKTILDATTKYKEYYLYGINTLEPNGWFSWWRHGRYGQNKAEEVCGQVQKYDTTEAIMASMELLFSDPYTQYDHHSYATHLLREFDKLLERHSLPGCKPPEGGNYTKESWFVVATQLQKLIPPLNTSEDSHDEGQNHRHGMQTL